MSAGQEGPWARQTPAEHGCPRFCLPRCHLEGVSTLFYLPQGYPGEGVNALSLSLLTVCEANTHCPHFAEEEMGSEVTWLVSGH